MVESNNSNKINTDINKEKEAQQTSKNTTNKARIDVDKVVAEKKLEEKRQEARDFLEQDKIKKLNIYQKISIIQSKIGEIVKDETNSFQKYKFFGELQVLVRLKPLLNKFNLLIMVSDDMANTEYNKLWHEKDGKEHYVSYPKKADVINLDNPTEKLVFNFWAAGQNTDIAKAKGCAETYSMKYFLTKFFLIPIKDKDDPDYKDNPNND